MTRTITAFFDGRAEAERAVQSLVSEIGLGRAAVRCEGGATSTASGGGGKGFFESLRDLFTPDEDRRIYAEGLRRGGAVVSVQVDDRLIDRAMDVLERHGAVNLDEREAAWRREGWGDVGRVGAAGGSAAARQGAPARDSLGTAVTDLVAIDFGTTRTKLAWFDGRRPELVCFENDKPYAPSLFHLPAGGGQILWGWDAEALLEEDPAGVVDVPKRRLRDIKVRANGRGEAPKQLLAAMFADLRDRAAGVAAFGGRAPSKVRLTRPVHYGPADERVMREAAAAAGFAEVGFVDEPVAAARAWAAAAGAAAGMEAVVVLDCGGGTVDWALLRSDPGGGGFRVAPECPPGGDHRVGGHDLDLGLLEMVKESLAERGEAATAAIDAKPVRHLAMVRALKEGLGLGGAAARPLRIGGREVLLDAGAIAALFEKRFVDQVCDGLAGYLEKARAAIPGEALPAVLLVGGAARLRGFKEAVERRLGCPALWWERSEWAAALGAATPVAPGAAVIRAAAPGRATAPPHTPAGRVEPGTQAAVVGATQRQPEQRNPAPASFGSFRSVFLRRPLLGSSPPPNPLDELAAFSAFHPRLNYWNEGGAHNIAFSPDGRLLASWGGDHLVRLRNAKTGREVHAVLGSQCGFSPDGHLFVTDETTTQFWKVGEWEQARATFPHIAHHIAFSPNALFFVDDSGTCIKRCSPASDWGRPALFARVDGYVSALAASQDGRMVAAAGSFPSDGGVSGTWIKVWDAKSSAELCSIRNEDGYLLTGGDVLFTPDSKTLIAQVHLSIQSIAAGKKPLQLEVWNTSSWRIRWSVKGGFGNPSINSFAVAPHGTFLALILSDGSMSFVDVATGRATRAAARRGDGQPPRYPTFSPDGRVLASTGPGARDAIRLLDVESGREVLVTQGHHSWPFKPVAFSADGRLAVSAGFDRATGQFGTMLWEIGTGRIVRVLDVVGLSLTGAILEEVSFGQWPTCCAFSCNGRRIAAAFGTRLRVWDAASDNGTDLVDLASASERPLSAGGSIGSFDRSIVGVAFSPDERTLVLGRRDGTIDVWSVDSFRKQRSLSAPGQRQPVSTNGLTMSPDGKFLAVRSSDSSLPGERTEYAVHVWETASGQKHAILGGHKRHILFVAFSPDGRRLASADGNGVVKLWDLTSGCEVVTHTGFTAWVHSVTVLPGGQLAIVEGGYAGPELWD